MPNKTVAILGCGWLGLPLAKYLTLKGHVVHGTTTRSTNLANLQKHGTIPHLADFSQHAFPTEDTFWRSDVLILAFPPKTKTTSGEWYEKAVKRIADHGIVHNSQKLILLSSTSVYPPIEGMMDELYDLESNCGNPSLYNSEKNCLESRGRTYVVRLGGLAGNGRLLAKHFAGKKELLGGRHPVNLLHQVDAVNAIACIVENEIKPGIYNICAPLHPTKEELYTYDCLRFGLPLPSFSEDWSGNKTINSQKFVASTGFQFQYPNPKEFAYDIDL